MPTAFRLFLWLAAVFAALPSHGQEAFPFAAFKADYARRGTMEILSNGTVTASGRIKMRFVTSTTGEQGRLKIFGNLRLKGAVRPFSAIYVFKADNIAAISDLAPGLDAGHSAEGIYSLLPKKITASFPFVFGTNAGEGTFQLRLRKRPRGLQMVATQTLSASTLPQSIIWKFQAISPR